MPGADYAPYMSLARATHRLEDFLRMPAATVLDVAATGHVLISSNETGTEQLYELAPGAGAPARLTELAERIGGLYVPGTRQVVAATDTGGDERHQLYLLDIDSGELQPLVVEPGLVHNLGAVSRDGSHVAYTCNRRNGVDFDVYVRDLRTGEERCVYDEGGMCMAYGFAPDGSRLAFARPGEAPMDADVLVADLVSGEVSVVAPHDEPAAVGGAEWAPDGALWITSNAGRDFAAIVRDGEYVLESDCDLSFTLSPDGSRLLVVENRDAANTLRVHALPGLEPVADVPLPGPGLAAGARFSHDGSRLWFGLVTAAEPVDVWCFDVDARRLERVTHGERPVPAETMARPESHWVESFDGERLHVLLYRPADAQGALPAVVVVHGGPEGQSTVAFNPITQYLVSRGYAVAVPNVRGSTGYGKRFYGLDDVRLRMDSVRDLAAVHGWLPSIGVDPNRVALWGGSYGGFMVLAGLAFQPELWAAGVDIVGISNFVTFLENTAAYRRRAREREYGSLEKDRDFLREISPLTHAESIAAPLFVIHGANDPRVPLSETQQIEASLQSRGFECPVLVYPDEGHGLAKLRNRLDAYPKAVDFLDRVL